MPRHPNPPRPMDALAWRLLVMLTVVAAMAALAIAVLAFLL